MKGETGMSQWLNDIVNEGGENCRNCSLPESPSWRALHGREIEKCPNCDDYPFDVYDWDDDGPCPYL